MLGTKFIFPPKFEPFGGRGLSRAWCSSESCSWSRMNEPGTCGSWVVSVCERRTTSMTMVRQVQYIIQNWIWRGARTSFDGLDVWITSTNLTYKFYKPHHWYSRGMYTQKWEKVRERERERERERKKASNYDAYIYLAVHEPCKLICPCIFTQESLAHMHLNLTSSIWVWAYIRVTWIFGKSSF